MHERDEWLTPRQVAAMAQLSEQTLANHRYRGIGIPFSKLTPGRSGRVRYRRSDVERWLAGEPIAA
ncbi:helix-turn-helix domain-containing protein [Streptomyces sp. NBC_01264]|uniref:helix-turn-helix domain-containing protein n=1 Tax=Streptomyces sp. NBC_01264 TaxID=2903804 RepID=UPI00224E525B|nr:helix-turn-helix domain-containing protein [Streptomyces sp. NBC_01264]MCX4780113.1 helix-turn-helix domain-containing protein [Streptomyces sp. NBC_01264]